MILSMNNIKKKFGNFTALEVENLEFEEGKYYVVLGPSGSGKTTLLRIVSGLEFSDSGQISILGKDMTNAPAWKRDIGLVFQNYALYPHLTVYENIASPLSVMKISRNETVRRVNELLRVMELSDQAPKYPGQLSGGQQQRVALARAIIKMPKILLLDEPLSNLDTRVRIDLRDYLKKIQREFKLTAIHVTHDPIEAMALGDEVIVLHHGKLVQKSTPKELYNRPNDIFCARLLGAVNLIPRETLNLNEDLDYEISEIRPEDVKIDDTGATEGKITSIQFLGSEIMYYVDIGNYSVKVKGGKYEDTYKEGDSVKLVFDLNNMNFYKGGKRVVPVSVTE
ncbi:MAG: ABC transporter ATP-binding protein [Ferroplasma sp.]|uniref:ABC transporter ATP-binding protein n=1 Tax=Ferroplasma sp. TaxID=2591003 RepID=UPI0028161944|nr:ABC transporter ATP-binding protein [Ferroplasma sp.]WMT50753.1 MAG: ABC transporter ATP-binding protein [Ferroplasma sp.]